MKVSANTAVQSQLSTLPASDQARVASVLNGLFDSQALTTNYVKQIPGDNTLFQVRITERLRALVRIRKDQKQVELLAIARPDQLEHYIKTQRAS